MPETKLYLSENQKDKIRLAQNKQQQCTLQIDKSKTPNSIINLTDTQLSQIKQGKRIKLSKTQLKVTGGFLPLAVLAPLIAKGAVTALAGIATKKVYDKVTGSGIKKKVGACTSLGNTRQM
jgi:hypothetical protein